MKDSAVASLQDCLADDLGSARQHLRELDIDQLKQLQKACMTLQNLAGARIYAMAQQNARAALAEAMATSSNRDSVQARG